MACLQVASECGESLCDILAVYIKYLRQRIRILTDLTNNIN